MTTNVAMAPAQPLRALERANQVRLARAELKRAIAAGSRAAAEVVLDCPWEARSMSVSELLTSQRRWGRARCRRLLLSIGVAENKELGALTARQRRCLAGVLSARAVGAGEDLGRAPAQPAPV
jgi:hypothetical protein